MILCVGEILADMIGGAEGGSIGFRAFAGGAPFNVAVAARRAGARVGFVGRVGDDVVGRFVVGEAQKAHFDFLDIQTDPERNTTLAFVSLTDGERDFTFHRHETADYHIDIDEIDFEKYAGLKILHLGSLMLSERAGRDFAKAVAEKAKTLGVPLSFDMNFRMDTYRDFAEARAAYAPFVEAADIIKFSEDELALYTGISDTVSAIESICHKDQLFVLTLGARGSMYYYNGERVTVPTKPVTPVDTTGAGDAFFGTLLAKIESGARDKATLERALREANAAGARATQHLGAVVLSDGESEDETVDRVAQAVLEEYRPAFEELAK